MSGTGWNGELELWFARKNDVTRLMRRRHLGPLAVQQPFYPEMDGSAHVYLLHPPGGVAGGDHLAIGCHVDAGANAVLTTPGATKFYRSDAAESIQQVTINVAAGGVCEYLPQETILFNGANVGVSTHVSLQDDAIYLGWECVSFGRPAAGESFVSGQACHRIRIERNGRPIWFEQFHLAGGSTSLSSSFALAGRPIMGTMVYAGPIAENLDDRVRDAFGELGRGVFSISVLERVVVCRYLGSRMSECKALFVRAWDLIRELGLGKRAVVPRIWAT